MYRLKLILITLTFVSVLTGCGNTTDPSDTTAPIVSAVQVSNITPTGAAVGFTTDEPSVAQLDYANDNYYAANSAYNQTESPSGYVTAHSVALSGLTPSTTYHYRITVKDAADNAATGIDRTFTTPAQDTTAPAISNPTPTPSSTLPAGTTSTNLGVSTDEAAQCRYATLANIAYASMPNSFTTTGSTTHSTALTGLTDGGAYSYYIRCRDGAGNANASDYTIAFTVATSGSVNRPPVLAFIADITVTEGETVSFSPSATDADLDNLTFSYSGWMTSSSYTTQAGDAGTHTVTVTVDDGNGGTDSQGVTVTVNSVSDTTPPVRSAGNPAGTLGTGTTSATLTLTTDENAVCRYGTTANLTYASMPNSFTTTGSLSHATSVTGLLDGNAYTYYVKCQDSSGNANTDDFPIAFSVAAPSGGNAFYVAPSGSDANPGSVNLPFLTIAQGLSQAQTGDTVYLRAGTYNELVNFPTAGNATGRITLKAHNGEAATITQTGRVMNVGQPYITVEDLVLDGGWGTQDILKVYSTGNYLVLRGVEIKNTQWDAVDMTAPSDVLVENCTIHDAVYINNGVRVDAHGIVTEGVQNLTVRNTEIYYVSGDAIQLQYGGWNNVLVEDSHLWSGPLPSARGGANAGDNVGEDGIDTKFHVADGRDRLTIKNTRVHGWGRGGNPLYASSAGLNIKHNVEVTIDGVSAYDNNYTFRLRGPGSNGEAWVTLMNSVIHDSNIGVRYEDGINNLHIYNSTFGNNIGSLFQSAGGYGSGLEVKNNLFLASALPAEADSVDANLAVGASDFIAADDYHLAATSQAIDFGVDLSLAGVVVDRDGVARPQGSHYDVGAYEYTGGASPTNRPPVLAAIADIEVTEGEVVSFNPSATDADTDSLTFTYTGWMSASSYTTQAGDAGIHTVTVTVHDGRGGSDSQDVAVTVNAAPDLTPPIISHIQVTNVTDTAATVSWTTDESADSSVEYGLTLSYGGQVGNSNLVTSHALSLTGLAANSQYHYRIQSRDGAGNIQTTSDGTFTTQAPAPTYQCNDGLDNDGDALIDMGDPGCSSPTDDDETDPHPPQCNDGLDNDGDTLIDMGDPGCSSLTDNDETDPILPQCNDGLDNDGDALIDMGDPGCSSPTDDDETDPPSGLPAWVDTNSPLALKMHPRLFLVPENYSGYGITVSGMRNRLTTDYQIEFQTFIDTLDTEYSTTVSTKGKKEMVNDAINFAFLYIIDPGTMSQPPYSFSFTYTQAEYGAKAKEHLLQIAQNVIAHGNGGINGPDTWADVIHLVQNGHINVSMSVTYDWLFPLLSLSDKQTVADAFIASYDNLVQNFLPHGFALTNNTTIAAMQNGSLGALAMWGDSIDNQNSTHYSGYMNTLLDAVKHDWTDRVFDWMNYISEGSSGWAEGPVYNGVSYNNFSRVFHIMGTALNRDYYSNSSYFVERPHWMLYNMEPMPNQLGETVWTRADDADPDRYAFICKSCYYSLSPLYNATGTLASSDPDSASLAKWIKDNSGHAASSSLSSSNSSVRDYYLLYYFFWEDKNVQSKSPTELNLPLSKKLGLGEFVMRTGFESADDTQIVFWAPKYFEQQSHAHFDFANFTITKYGNLAVQRSIAKSFSGGNFHETARSMFYNTVGVYKPGETHYKFLNLMGYRTSYDANANFKTDAAYQPGGANHVGNVPAYDLEGSNYDYINYDYSRAWDSTKVDYANRQFVYLRSQGGANDEYVVVLDRISTVDPSYTKYYLLHSSFTPSVATDTIEITNNWSSNGSHGRLFNKILLPASYRINQISDWQDADGSIIYSAAGLTDQERNYHGSSTLQIESTTNQNHDTYLNVMQLGDANTLTAMSPTTRIDASSMTGTAIDDPTVSRVVLFSSDPYGAAISNVTYAVGSFSATTAKHLLLDMQPGTYNVYRDSALIYSGLAVSANGVLAFDSTGGSTYAAIKQ